MQIRRDFLDQLIRFRKESGMTQMELAARSGISQQQISKIESGLSNPHLDTLLALLMALHGTLTIQPSESTSPLTKRPRRAKPQTTGQHEVPPSPRSIVDTLVGRLEDEGGG